MHQLTGHFSTSTTSECSLYVTSLHSLILFIYFRGQTLDILQAEEAINRFYRKGINQAFNWITWNDEAVTDFQNSVNSAQTEHEVCTTNRVSAVM